MSLISMLFSRWVPVMFCAVLIPLLSLPVLGHARTVPVCDVFSQDAFYRSSVKVDKSVALEFNIPKVYFDFFL